MSISYLEYNVFVSRISAFKVSEIRNTEQRKEKNVFMGRRRSGSAQRSVHAGAPAAAQKLPKRREEFSRFSARRPAGPLGPRRNFNQTVTSPAGAKLRNPIRVHPSTLTRTKRWRIKPNGLPRQKQTLAIYDLVRKSTL